jgi:phosphopentomutase
MRFKRVVLCVLDSLGVGAARDADKYGDGSTNTLKHIVQSTDLELTNLAKFGLFNLINENQTKAYGYYTKALPVSVGTDSTTGHQEMMGLIGSKPAKKFTENGFPKDLIKTIEMETGRNIIGNKVASGTEIIAELGEEHIKTGKLIIYTSADPVLQIAAHESIIPVSELYRICEIVRKITLKDEWKVERVIARPFTGKPGAFTRTSNRKDYSLDPADITVLDKLKENKFDVLALGKISDLFNGRGITASTHTDDNFDGIKKLVKLLSFDFTGLCFVNFNDYDSKYGHRRDVNGYASCLKEFDKYYPNIINALTKDDLIILTADHGNDPTFTGTDHTRENVPVLVYSKRFSESGELPYLQTFADIGATILENFDLEKMPNGNSFLNKLK